MAQNIQTYQSTSLLALSKRWAELKDDELRRKAVQVANERDKFELWDMTQAHIFLFGAKGASVSKNTLDAYRRAIFQLIEAWQGENLLRPSRDAGALYIRGLEAKYKPSTVQQKLAAVKHLYKALRWANATAVTPFIDVKAAPDPTPAHAKRQPYTSVELRRLLEIADDDLVVLILLGAHAGLRISEMLNLFWEDIDYLNNLIRIKEGKGGKQAQVVMSRSLMQALTKWQKVSKGDYVLPFRHRVTAHTRMVRLCRRAKVTPKGLHALRHSAGTHMRQAGADIADIADHLRHSQLETARGYAKQVDSVVRGVIGEW